MKSANVEISTSTIVKALLLVILVIFLWQIRFIVLLLLTAYIFMTGFAQLADFLRARGLNKIVSAIMAYLLLIIVIFVVVFLVVPPVIAQLRDFVVNTPDYLVKLNSTYSKYSLPIISNQDLSKLLASRLDSFLSNFVSIIVNTLNFFLNFLTVAVISFYLLLERDKFKDNLFRLFPRLPKDRVTRLANRVESQLGSWLKGQLLLMVIVGVATYIGLVLLKVDYALPLAIIAGILEAVPIIGPILSSIPAVIITFTVSPVAALGVGLLYILIQQLENNVLVPQIMKQAVAINPILTILAILVGAELFGIVGVVLSVPIAAVIQVVLTEFIDHPLNS